MRVRSVWHASSRPMLTWQLLSWRTSSAPRAPPSPSGGPSFRAAESGRWALQGDTRGQVGMQAVHLTVGICKRHRFGAAHAARHIAAAWLRAACHLGWQRRLCCHSMAPGRGAGTCLFCENRTCGLRSHALGPGIEQTPLSPAERRCPRPAYPAPPAVPRQILPVPLRCWAPGEQSPAWTYIIR